MAMRSLEVQKAVVTALKVAPAVAALVGTRVYDQPPQSPTYPYIRIGDVQGEPWEGTNLAGWSGVMEIDCWSQKPGKVEAQQIGNAAFNALHRVDGLTLDADYHITGDIIGQSGHTFEEDRATIVRLRYQFRTHD